MAFATSADLESLDGETSYTSPSNHEHECVALIQALTKAGPTRTWKRGIKVMDAPLNSIPKGTVIATFDENGQYPVFERHAALYVSHNAVGITVYQQYKKGVRPGKVHKAVIKNRKLSHRTTMDADYYYIVE